MYNYVFYFKNEDLFKNISKDILGKENVKFVYKFPDKDGNLLKLLHRVVFSSRIPNPSMIRLTRNAWNQLYFNNEFKDKHPLCFIFDRNNDYYFRKTGYYEYLRKVYRDCKLVFVFHDRVEGTSRPYREDDREYLAKTFDEIFVYNLLDAKKFGYKYFPAYESRLCPPHLDEYLKADIFYAGEAKDRVKMIQSVCRKANASGLKCYFYIRGAKKAEQLPLDGIIYSDRWMSFTELLARASRSRCMLDIIQGHAAGFTSRFWHAVF